MTKSYSGYYNGVFLRSSYEFAYAKYLEQNRLNWKYEERSFQIGENIYLPDFFIYENDVLKYIVEVKSGIPEEIEKAKRNLRLLKELYGIEGKLILYKDLKELYKGMPQSISSTIKEWITNEHTNNVSKWFGEQNPHFGMKQSEETKRIISLHTIARWKDEKIKAKMLSGSLKGALKAKEKLSGVQKKPREKRTCGYCKNEFEVIISSKKNFAVLNVVRLNTQKKQPLR